MSRRFDISGRTVLLTGASSGVGAALAARLVERDCRVVAWSRRPPPIGGPSIIHEAVDLSDMAALDAALDGLLERHPELSVVINNAGVSERADLADGDPARLDELAEIQIAVNLQAPIRICQRLFAPFSRRGTAMIVNNTSGLAVAPTVPHPVYCASKAGLRAFTQSMRYQAEAAGGQIAVIEILLAVVETPLNAGYAGRKMPVDKAVDRIMRGLAKAEPEIWVGQAALLRRIAGISPALARHILKVATG
ncbi:SDR family NAD(P)-dependent oxidoreductase [Aurantimonas sp. A2-1-M11]|uniref:SDR family NAD(P)-dependent oxidoreductase n=1 Tax=Aurantimonas sp. A2-1-M11 TaxID=3113712 RepID=UPI002F91DCF8